MSLQDSVVSRFERTFGASPSVVVTAPGRVEVIGNHTDYNQGPVIGAAIDRGVYVALRRIAEPVFRFVTADRPVVAVDEPSQPLNGERSWVNYALGVYKFLIPRGLITGGGFEMAIESDVPSGSGLSSSAALELASAKAIAHAYRVDISTKDLALVGREAENEFVGVPCGILDQGVSAFGQADHLVHIDCRTLEFSTIPLGGDYSIWIFNTHKKHSLVESLYSARHRECFEAVEQLRASGLAIDSLADVAPSDFEEAKKALEPTVAKRAAHVVSEIARVKRAKQLLLEGRSAEIGELLLASHASSRDFFENSVPELDYLVSIIESMPGTNGARLTGGGFGGAAMALANRSFTWAYADAVASAYRGQFGEAPEVIRCGVGDGARVLCVNGD